MITIKDCLDYCELSKKAVNEAAVRNHEPIIVSIAHTISHSEYSQSNEEDKAPPKKYRVEDISNPYKIGKTQHPQKLTTPYKKFNTTYG